MASVEPAHSVPNRRWRLSHEPSPSKRRTPPTSPINFGPSRPQLTNNCLEVGSVYNQGRFNQSNRLLSKVKKTSMTIAGIISRPLSPDLKSMQLVPHKSHDVSTQIELHSDVDSHFSSSCHFSRVTSAIASPYSRSLNLNAILNPLTHPFPPNTSPSSTLPPTIFALSSPDPPPATPSSSGMSSASTGMPSSSSPPSPSPVYLPINT